ncbi:MAG TPA: hypothetical protein VFH68_08830 [Polyangia bacterium]|nr:hypothetical protein [Polyangia bacterium]
MTAGAHPVRPRAHPLAVTLIIAVTLLVLAATRATLLGTLARRATWPAEDDTLALPTATAVRVASLGHTELAADLIAARANVYFGAQIAARGDHRWLERYLTAALDLDPQFHGLYRRGATMLVYTGKEFSIDALLAADRILARGVRAFPSDWEIWFQQGFNLLFELPPLAGEDDPRVPGWRERGVESLRQATLLDGAPPWLPNLAAQMLTRQGGDALALRHLEHTYAVTSDPATREQIRRKLEALHGPALAAELAREAADLRRLVEQRYPYAPEAYSLVAGPRFTWNPGTTEKFDQADSM